jgi:nucleoside 2-deoxyribosyltransferase
MSKRVYLAGPWIAREAMPKMAEQLEAAGHKITHKWWEYEGENQDEETDEFLRSCAEQDVAGVVTADVVIVYNTAKSEGKAVEQGIAIVVGHPIIVVTPYEKPSSNIFHYLPQYTHVKTFQEALEIVNG